MQTTPIGPQVHPAISECLLVPTPSPLAVLPCNARFGDGGREEHLGFLCQVTRRFVLVTTVCCPVSKQFREVSDSLRGSQFFISDEIRLLIGECTVTGRAQESGNRQPSPAAYLTSSAGHTLPTLPDQSATGKAMVCAGNHECFTECCVRETLQNFFGSGSIQGSHPVSGHVPEIDRFLEKEERTGAGMAPIQRSIVQP